MRSGLKKKMRSAAGLASLLNGLWAYQVQEGNPTVDFLPVATAVLAVWVCYFSIAWILQGMRSDP